MKPSQVVEQLQKIATNIGQSNSPSATAITSQVRQIISSLEHGEDFWLNRADVAAVCPPCARKMEQLHIKRVAASALFGQDMLLLASAKTADKWKSLPKGWTGESRKKLWQSLGGSVTDCMEKMSGKVDDPGAFCGSLEKQVGKKD